MILDLEPERTVFGKNTRTLGSKDNLVPRAFPTFEGKALGTRLEQGMKRTVEITKVRLYLYTTRELVNLDSRSILKD